MTSDRPSQSSSESAIPESKPPPGKLLDAVGLSADAIWPSTRVAIEAAGYTELGAPIAGAKGATCVVYKALEPATRRRVALKIILDPKSERSMKQFEREVTSLCWESLPGCVVRYLNKIKSKDGEHQPVLVLEYIEGRSLRDYAKAPGRTEAQRIDLCHDLFGELGRIHACGRTHGDISPNNVLVDGEGHIRFIDLGLSNEIEPDAYSANSVDGPKGTQGYAPPVVLDGDRRILPCDDMRAAAAVAFRMLSGRTVGEIPVEQQADKRLRREHRKYLSAASVPKGLAGIIVDALHDGEAQGRMDGTMELAPEPGAVASQIQNWRESRRQVEQRWRTLAAVLLVGLPLAWLAFTGWERYRSELSAAQERSTVALDGEIELRPNRSHPAVVEALAAAKTIRARWREQLGRGDTAAARRSQEELLEALRVALRRSHEVEAIDPLRASLGEVLVRTPWQRSCPTIAKREAELGKRLKTLDEAFDSGDLEGTWAGLRGLQRKLADLAADNVTALRAVGARDDYRRLERGVAPRLRALSGWQPQAARAEEAADLLAKGRFNDSATEFGQVTAQLNSFLTRNETASERHERFTMDETMAQNLELRIDTLEGEITEANNQLESLRIELASAQSRGRDAGQAAESLRAQLARVEGERERLAGARDALASKLAAAERQRDAAQRSAKSLTKELSEAKALAQALADRPMAGVGAIKTGVKLNTGIGLTMIWVEPGTFQMGSPADEERRWSGGQSHSVTLTRAYALGESEVTQKQWREVMGIQPWKGEDYTIEGDEVAASYVSWTEAVKFCKRLTERERAAGRLPAGYEYTLPTEAEWERASRAGSRTPFSFGNDESDLGRYAVFSESRSGQYAHAVKSKRPNAWGFYDLLGNVWEWCADAESGILADWLAGFSNGVAPPLGTGGPRRGVLRGGDWSSSATWCRSVDRSVWGFGIGLSSRGFRPVLAARSGGE